MPKAQSISPVVSARRCPVGLKPEGVPLAIFALLLSSAIVGACAAGPDFQRPDPRAPTRWSAIKGGDTSLTLGGPAGSSYSALAGQYLSTRLRWVILPSCRWTRLLARWLMFSWV